MHVLFIGLPGVGKTSLVCKISPKNAYEIINIGDLMKNSEFNALDELGSETKKNIAKRSNICKYIGAKRNTDLLITGHGIIFIGMNRYEVGFTAHDLQLMDISLLVIIEALPSIICKRRSDDFIIRNDRLIEDETIVAKNQQKQKMYYTKICKNNNTPFFVFNNSFDFNSVENTLEINRVNQIMAQIYCTYQSILKSSN